MASLLRQIVAGPRARHPEAGLDLCYVTDNSMSVMFRFDHDEPRDTQLTRASQ